MLKVLNYLFICLFILTKVESSKLKVTLKQTTVHLEGYIKFNSNKSLVPMYLLSNDSIIFRDSNKKNYNATITSDGTYEITLPTGIYTRIVSDDKFENQRKKICIQSKMNNYDLKNFIYLTPKVINIVKETQFRIRGYIKIATTNENIDPDFFKTNNASIIFTNVETKLKYRATFFRDSTYEVRLPKGLYNRVVSFTNFSEMNQTFNYSSHSGLEQQENTVYLSPIVQGYRLILTWGENPKDLDISVITPTQEEINYLNRVSKDGRVFIDVDNKNGFGPETISLENIVPGIYKVIVARFTHEATLQESNAKVIVFKDSRLIGEYKVPTNGDPDHNYWQVLNIEHPSGNITSVNQITLLKNPTSE